MCHYFCIVGKSCSAAFVMTYFIRVGGIGHRTYIHIYYYYNEILHASIRASSPIKKK